MNELTIKKIVSGIHIYECPTSQNSLDILCLVELSNKDKKILLIKNYAFGNFEMMIQGMNMSIKEMKKIWKYKEKAKMSKKYLLNKLNGYWFNSNDIYSQVYWVIAKIK